MTANLEPTSRHTSTREEYFALERSTELRYEYHSGGQIVAMAGGSPEHARVCMNISRELSVRLNGRPCEAFNEAMRVKVRRSGQYFYPDASAVCGGTEIDTDAERIKSLANPNVIVEVLSPSNERYDWREKLDAYFLIDSVRDYLLVDQDEPRVTIIRRHADGERRIEAIVGLDQTVKLTSIGIEIPMKDIYRNVEFPPPQKTAVGAVAEGK